MDNSSYMNHLNIETHNFLDAIKQNSSILTPKILEEMATWGQKARSPAFLDLTQSDQEFNKAQHWSQQCRNQANRLVILGIGGSSLGGQMLVNALAPNGLPVTFYDNICPEFLAALYTLPWSECFVLAVSKSGNTSETLAQLLTLLPILQKQLGSGFNTHAAVITENPDSALGRIALELAIPIIAHPPVGGRFSVLSITGLLPAAFAGADIQSLLAGAEAMAQHCLSTNPDDNPALRFALAQAHMALNGKNISVIMAYGQRLEKISTWFRQLWAESLGKIDASGQKQGITPIDARGVTDQHSQLQLYLDGPEDKQFSLLYDPTLAQQGAIITAHFAALPAVAPLAGRSVGELFAAEFLGTRDALIHRGAPVRVFNLEKSSAYALGELILLLEMETLITAQLLAVTPFDQPAVEESKQRARTYLTRNAHTTNPLQAADIKEFQ